MIECSQFARDRISWRGKVRGIYVLQCERQGHVSRPWELAPHVREEAALSLTSWPGLHNVQVKELLK